MERTENTGNRGLKGPLLASLGLAAMPAASFLGAALAVIFLGDGPAMYALAQVCTAGLTAALAYWLSKAGGTGLGRGADATGLFSGIAVMTCFYPASVLVSEAAGKLSPGGGAVSVPDMPPALAWFVLALLPAVSEELACRGLVFGAFRKYGAPAAVFLSAAGFAALHGSVQQAAYTFFLGLVWGALRECTGSAVPGIISHLAFNSMGVMAMFQPSVPAAARTGFWHSYGALAAVSAAMAMFGVSLLAGLRARNAKLGAVYDADPERVHPAAAVAAAFAIAANIAVNAFLAAA